MSESIFDRINRWYNTEPKLWTIDKVKEAVVKKVITQKEYKQITGEKYTKE